MKIIKILLNNSKNLTEEKIRAFLYSNFPNDLIRGLEYDDPKAIGRALKLLGIKSKIPDDDSEMMHHPEMDTHESEGQTRTH